LNKSVYFYLKPCYSPIHWLSELPTKNNKEIKSDYPRIKSY
jgi:hypothetical protein